MVVNVWDASRPNQKILDLHIYNSNELLLK
jgi:hypothetical protein